MGLQERLVTRKGNLSLTTLSLWELRDRPVRRCAVIPKLAKSQARGGLVTSLGLVGASQTEDPLGSPDIPWRPKVGTNPHCTVIHCHAS